MDALDVLLTNTREAMTNGQDAVAEALRDALRDPDRLGAAIRTRPKPWFFAADETMTVFCTEGRPGNASAPHDHGAWAVLGCFDGSEESWWHETSQDGLVQVGSGVLRTGEAHSLPDTAVHAVMNRWNAPNGIIHIYHGNFLAAERHVWDPITNAKHPAGLSEPLAPTNYHHLRTETTEPASSMPALAGTAFAAINVVNLANASHWMSEAFGLQTLTTEDTSCSTDEQFRYLIEPASLTIVGLHSARSPQPAAGLEHVALRVPSIAQLEQWHHDLNNRNLNPSPITQWNFGTFIDVIGPEQLTVRLFVPAVR
jgi:predicted metal-dependent enzyme (double-stranded beta helix superfamily)